MAPRWWRRRSNDAASHGRQQQHVFQATDERTNKRTNKQTNRWTSLSRKHPALRRELNGGLGCNDITIGLITPLTYEPFRVQRQLECHIE